MDNQEFRRLASSVDYPGVVFGIGVVLCGSVRIASGTQIGDYSVIGTPSIEHIEERDQLIETVIGRNTLIGSHVIIHNGAQIGNGVKIDDRCNIGWQTKVGDGSRLVYGAKTYWNTQIGQRCIVGGFCCDRAHIEDDVVMFGSLVHKFMNMTSEWNTTEEPSPKIERRVFIGFNSIIVGGITIHERAFIAAGTTVTKDVPPDDKVIGNK